MGILISIQSFQNVNINIDWSDGVMKNCTNTLTLDKLQNLIEQKKQQMIENGLLHGLSHKKTVSLSTELDSLLNKHRKFVTDKQE